MKEVHKRFYETIYPKKRIKPKKKRAKPDELKLNSDTREQVKLE